MNKVSLLAASVAIALTGCGGSDGGSKPVEASGIVITAIDGYLHNAEIWVDKDGNLANGCELNTEIMTDEDGKATISKADFAGMNVCIKAVAGKTIDNDRGLVAKGFNLASPASESNNVIVNPMTNMIVEQMAHNSELTPATAKDEVVNAITDTGLKVDADMIFGDYLASTSNEAKALKVIGETLVDNNDKSVETQLAISTEVATEANDIIEESPEDLDNYAPVVEITPEGGVTVKPNSRPVVDVSPEEVSMELGDAWVTVDASKLFSDADGDTLTYTMKALGTDKNGLDIVETTGLITGTPKVAGKFIYQIFAEDTKGSISYPANLNVTIETPNTAPTHNPEALETIQNQLNALTLTQGDEVNKVVIVATGLFNDVDGDTLKYTVENVPAGMSVTLNKDELTLSGTPSSHGESTIRLFANDGVNQTSAEADIILTIEKAAVTPSHPLEGKTWYYLEHGSDDGNDNDDFDYSRVWCDSIKFEGGIVYGNVRSSENRTECTDADTQMEDATYKVENGRLIATFKFEEDGESLTESFEVDVAGNAEDLAQGAKTIVHRPIALDETAERYTYFADESDAEARIQVKSDDSYDKRFGYMYLPAEQDNTYDLGMVSFALVEGSQSYKAYMNFDVEGKDFNCNTINEFYRSFTFSGDDLTTPYSQHYISGRCSTQFENGVEYASVYFDLSGIQNLEIGNVYSFIGKTKDENAEYVEAVKFSIEWTGEGDNE
ncbi:putative Ig domain-containing protein [Vibrio campbellii]|uniref:putative Ig domain-containing protein n=1 Tax=Vibrio campbellii TaxID=680 RepID=UPI0038578BEF